MAELAICTAIVQTNYDVCMANAKENFRLCMLNNCGIITLEE